MSESHWKMMTEQRQQAIQETNIENEQVGNSFVINIFSNIFRFHLFFILAAYSY